MGGLKTTLIAPGNRPKDRAAKPQVPPRDPTFHFTNPAMAARLVSSLPLTAGDVVLDPSAGSGAFYDAFPSFCKRLRCEIQEDGRDFLLTDFDGVSWAITNPPFHLAWKFIEKASDVCSKGFAYLLSTTSFNSLSPGRLDHLDRKGFRCAKIRVVEDARWYGRYYFVVFQKGADPLLEWDTTKYSKGNILPELKHDPDDRQTTLEWPE